MWSCHAVKPVNPDHFCGFSVFGSSVAVLELTVLTVQPFNNNKVRQRTNNMIIPIYLITYSPFYIFKKRVSDYLIINHPWILFGFDVCPLYINSNLLLTKKRC